MNTPFCSTLQSMVLGQPLGYLSQVVLLDLNSTPHIPTFKAVSSRDLTVMFHLYTVCIIHMKPGRGAQVRPHITKSGQRLALEWSRGRVFDFDIATMFHTLVSDGRTARVPAHSPLA